MNAHSLAGTNKRSRALLVRRVTELGWSVKTAASAVGISERAAYKWLARGRAEGTTHLVDRSSRPRRMPSLTSKLLEESVVALRRQRMTIARIAAQLKLGSSTVARIVKRHGLSRLKFLDPPVPIIRYEHPRPGDMIHVDIKKLGRFQAIGHRITGVRTRGMKGRNGWEYVHVCIDDHSRVSYVEVLADEKGPTTAGFLKRAVAWFREMGVRVRRVMSDNGSAYRSRFFAQMCARLRLAHVKTRPYTPRTNGKAERFIQTMLREWAYARPYINSAIRHRALVPWLRYYNERRIHGTIGSPPINRLRRAA